MSGFFFGGGGATRNEEWVLLIYIPDLLWKKILYADARNYEKKNHLKFHNIPKVYRDIFRVLPFLLKSLYTPNILIEKGKKVIRSWFMTLISLITIIICDNDRDNHRDNPHCLQLNVKILLVLFQWPDLYMIIHINKHIIRNS